MQVTHPELQLAADVLQKFLFAWFLYWPDERVEKCVLYGGSGNGKTTMARNAYLWVRATNVKRYFTKAVVDHIPGPRFVYWQQVCDELNNDGTFSYIDELAGSSMLFLDDVGAEADRFKNKHTTDALCYLLTICQGRTPLVITTNEAPGDWATRWDTRTDDRLLRDARLISFENIPSWARIL